MELLLFGKPPLLASFSSVISWKVPHSATTRPFSSTGRPMVRTHLRRPEGRVICSCRSVWLCLVDRLPNRLFDRLAILPPVEIEAGTHVHRRVGRKFVDPGHLIRPVAITAVNIKLPAAYFADGAHFKQELLTFAQRLFSLYPAIDQQHEHTARKVAMGAATRKGVPDPGSALATGSLRQQIKPHDRHRWTMNPKVRMVGALGCHRRDLAV